MAVVAVILILGVCIALAAIPSIVNKRKMANAQQERIAQGRLVDRGKSLDWFKQVHVFITKTPSIADIGGAIDFLALAQDRVIAEPDYEKGRIIFAAAPQGKTSLRDNYMRSQGFSTKSDTGSFRASLICAGQEESAMRYQFKVDSYTAVSGNLLYADILAVNVLLTAVEKAILSLDPETEVQRIHGTYGRA